MKKRVVAITLMLALMVTLLPLIPGNDAYAASKRKKMITNSGVIKKGNTAYCCVHQKGLYKVNLKTKKVTKMKTKYYLPEQMKIYKGYLYFIASTPDEVTLG